MCDDHKNSIQKDVKKRLGSTIDHGALHEKDHKKWSRRVFLRNTGLGMTGGYMMLGSNPVSAFAPNKLMQSLINDDSDRVLVLIRLQGGNDGLNTVVNYTNDEYYNIRPSLAIPPSDLWKLDDDFGMHNGYMSSLEPFWEEGRMKVVHNVGYPDQDYSHFRSSDIWASASDRDEYVSSGWIGRLFDSELDSFQDAPPVVPPALQIGVQTNLIFQAEFGPTALAVSNPAEFYRIASSGQLYNTNSLSTDENDQELKFVRNVFNSAFRYSESIRQAYNTGQNEVEYPDNYLAEQLAILSRLIKGRLGTKIYMVTIGGFDTHADQVNTHPLLMERLSTSIDAFFKDLKKSEDSKRVLGMTFSEFGRTIFENGSAGTDHGTGGPMLIFGDDIGSGFVGDAPDLNDLNMYGDPNFDVDFRDVYGTVLNDWMGTDSVLVDHVLNKNFNNIDGLVPPANINPGTSNFTALIGYNPDPERPGNYQVKYVLKKRGNVKIKILNKSGMSVRTLVDGFRERGTFKYNLDPAKLLLASGEYVLQLQTAGKKYTSIIRI